MSALIVCDKCGVHSALVAQSNSRPEGWHHFEIRVDYRGMYAGPTPVICPACCEKLGITVGGKLPSPPTPTLTLAEQLEEIIFEMAREAVQND